MIPDADTLGYFAGIPYESVWGHRGITHSIFFSLIFGTAITLVSSKSVPLKFRLRLFLFYFLCTLSHPLLDAITNGGLGVALFAPFNNERFFFAFRPVQVSPMGAGFLSIRGLTVLLSEFVWICLPSFVLAALLKRWQPKHY